MTHYFNEASSAPGTDPSWGTIQNVIYYHKSLIIVVESGGWLEWSLNGGATVHGRLNAGESISLDTMKFSTIVFRRQSTSVKYRAWCM